MMQLLPFVAGRPLPAGDQPVAERTRSHADRPAGGAGWSLGGLPARRYLPWALLATSSIVALPAILGGLIAPGTGVERMAASAASTVLVSLALAAVEASLWKRWRGSQDLLFADLMLWNCARRWWIDRRLGDIGRSYEAAVQTGGPVRIELLEGLSRLLAARSAHTHGHGRRVARHAERIARTMRLPAEEVARIRTAAVVHDLGKIYTPVEILDKPVGLTEEEFEVIKRHSVDGAELLGPVRDPELAAIVRHHHERLDGSGYPDGLVGEQIPLGARIVAVADTFDALTSTRPYRPANSHKQGLEILDREAGSRLDDQAVAAFVRRYSARPSLAWMSFAAAISARALAAFGFASGGLSAGGASLGQLVPALGAAGLLSLSPAIQQQTLHQKASLSASGHSLPALGQVSGFGAAAHTGGRTRNDPARTSPKRSPRRRTGSGHVPASVSPSHGAGHRAGRRPSGSSSPSRPSSSLRSSASAPAGVSANSSTRTQAQPTPPPSTTPSHEPPPSSNKEEAPSLPVSPPVTAPEVEASVPGTEVTVKTGGSGGPVSAKV